MDIHLTKKSHDLHYFRSLLTCEYCKRVFNSPVVLPCGETVCARDIKDMYLEDHIGHIIICYFCGKHHHCENPFPSNKIVESFLQHDLANFSLGKSYEHAKKSLDNLKEKLNIYEKLIINPAQYLYEFFDEISNKIQHKKESLKVLADLKCEKMLKDLGLFKDECQNALDATTLNFLPDKINKSQIDDLKKKVENWYTEIEKPLDIHENKWNSIYLESQSIDNDLEKSIKQIKDRIFLNIECKFEEKQIDSENFFGELKLDYPEIECAKSHLKLRCKKHKLSTEEKDIKANMIESEILKKQLSSEPQIFYLNPKE